MGGLSFDNIEVIEIEIYKKGEVAVMKGKKLLRRFLVIAMMLLACGSSLIAYANESISDKDLIISAPYHIKYDKNTTDSVTSMPSIGSSFWREKGSVSTLEPARRGYTFIDWNTQADGTGKTYTKGQSIVLTGHISLYAQWKANEYQIHYELDGGTNHKDNPSKYTYGIGVSEFKEATKPGYEFLGWYSDPEFKNPITSISKTQLGEVTLYAKWSKLIRVVYDGNDADKGTVKTEVVSEVDCTNGYSVKNNKGFTSYEKEDFGFAGWDSFMYQISYKASYKKEQLPQTIDFEELVQISESQAKATKAKSKSSAGKASDEIPTATMYAIWDEAPSIKFDGDTLTFYEGETVTKEMLLEKVESFDSEDDAQKLPLKIRITKLQYDDGKLVDGKPQKGITETWETDMPDDYQLDTWFLQMEKDSTATHTITYAVTDSFGNTTERDWTIKVKYNNFPEIKGEDRYFTLEEAQSGAITYEELMSRARAWDKEDCAKESCMEGHENCLDDETLCDFGKNNLKIVGFDAEEFTSFTESGYVVLNYYVKDSVEKQYKEAYKQFVVYISKDGEVVQGPETKHVRFIDEANYDKNASVSQDGLSEEELEALNQNGGLHVGSKWYTEEEYRDLLLSTLEHPTSEDVWFFEYADIEKVKTYVKEHGVGNSESDSGLSGFLDSFQGNKQN